MSRSKLFVNRFAVFGAGKFLYDENFHSGVNIIRGKTVRVSLPLWIC